MRFLQDKWKAVCFVVGSLRVILTGRQKRLGILNFVIALIGSFLQMLGVSIIVPVVTLMMEPNGVSDNRLIELMRRFLPAGSSEHFFVLLCAGTVFLYLGKDLFCVFQVWFSTKYAQLVARELSMKMMSSYMDRSYDFFLNYGSQEILRDVESDPNSVNQLMQAGYVIINEMLTVLLIMIYFVSIDWRMSLCVAAIAIFCLLVIYVLFKGKMKQYGVASRERSATHQKVFYESVEGIKEIQVMRRKSFFLERYTDTYISLQKTALYLALGSTSPTYMVEGVFVGGIVAYVGIRSSFDPAFSTMLPILSSFAVGAIRMLPSMGRISSSLNLVSFAVPALTSLREHLQQVEADLLELDCREGDGTAGTKESFEDALVLSNIFWHYTGSQRQILTNLDLTVHKGESVGLIGASGAGKTTLADIILGLHIPQQGKVLLDGIDIYAIPDDYARIIGYVPQSIYLVDGTIRENVAFGEDPADIREEDIWASLEQAQLAEHVRSLPEGLDTIVGERGVRFSGGQRQRLAIARALYRKPQILILDEATSALDNETEAAVMDAIEHLYGTITMIIIAHRLTTVAKCDAVYEIRDGKAVRTEVPGNP